MVKRPDRTSKLKQRGETEETVVKCSLNRLIQEDLKDKISAAIQKRVKECSERLNYGSISINLLIRKLFDGVEDVADVELPEFWDQTFVRQALLGTDSAYKPIEELETFFGNHPDMVIDQKQKRSTEDGNIYTAAAIKLGTNIRNHLVLNFPKILKLYLYKILELNGTEGFEVQKELYGWEIQKKKKKKEEEKADPEKVKQALASIRKIVGKSKLGTKWFETKNNLKEMLRFFVLVMRKLEENENNKLYSLLPICKIRNHFVTIDNNVFFGILKEIGVVNERKKGLEDDVWRSVFKIDLIETKSIKFTGTIDTDGVSVCVHFRRPTRKKKKKKDEISIEGKRVVAVDPGRRNLFTMVELVGGKWKVYSLTRQQYYQESGIIDSRKNTEKWSKNIKSNIDELSKASPKGQSLETFEKFVAAWKKNKDALMEEYSKKRWSKERMMLHGKKKRTFAKFFNKIIGKDDPKNIVLAYGSAKFAPGGKGEVSVPTSRAFKECSYRFKLIKLVDEFRTSRLFWRDCSILKTVQKYKESGKNVSVNGLLWCCSTNPAYANKYVNRDVNAAKNIYACAVAKERPAAFDRKQSEGPLPKAAFGSYI